MNLRFIFPWAGSARRRGRGIPAAEAFGWVTLGVLPMNLRFIFPWAGSARRRGRIIAEAAACGANG